MSLDERLSHLVRKIYCADPEGPAWDSIRAEVLQQTGACSGLCTVVDLKRGEMANFSVFGRESSGVADAISEYPDKLGDDPSLLWAVQNPAAGFCASSVAVKEREYLSNGFVKWNRSRMGATHWYVCYSKPGLRFSQSLSIHIPHSQGAATKDQISKFRMLFGHLESAAWLHRAPCKEAAAGIWMVLDCDARVVMLSPDAEALVSSADGLNVREGRLVTCDPISQRALEKTFARTAASFETGAGPAAVWVERRLGGRPWLLSVRPLTTAFAGLARVALGFHVEILEPEPQCKGPSSLCLMFDLSAREAKVLEMLARGYPLNSLAEVLSISVNTAKVHLQAIFTKTRTRRQVELLQLCSRLGIN